MTEGARADVVRLLDEALATPRLREVPESLAARLRGCAARDVAELQGPLESRAEVLAERNRRLLAERGEKEAREMLDILQAQRDRIARRQEEVERKTAQGLLGLDCQKEEIRQMESDLRHWKARLRDLEGELKREPARIRDLYQVKTRRIEPVGLVYLWPVSR
jgi:chromosome segregation ATPase